MNIIEKKLNYEENFEQINLLETFFDSDYVITQFKIFEWLIKQNNFDDLINNDFFSYFFSYWIEYFKINIKEFNDNSHRLNFVKKSFKNWKNEPASNEKMWAKVKAGWQVYFDYKLKSKVSNYPIISSLKSYYGNIKTMVKINENDEKNDISENNDEVQMNEYNQKFVDKYIGQSFLENDLFNIIFKIDNKFANQEKLKVYTVANDKTSNYLNNEQLQALLMSHNKKVLNIQGPPGTGKTTLIKDIVVSLFMNNKTVWVASGNNQAVDNVMESFASDKILKNLPIVRLGNTENIKKTFIDKFINFKPLKKNTENLSKKGIDIKPLLEKLHLKMTTKDNFYNQLSFFENFVFLNDEVNTLMQHKDLDEIINYHTRSLKKWDKFIKKYESKKVWFFIFKIFKKMKFKKLLRKLKNLELKPFEFENIRNENITFYIKHILTLLEILKQERQNTHIDLKEIKAQIRKSTTINQEYFLNHCNKTIDKINEYIPKVKESIQCAGGDLQKQIQYFRKFITNQNFIEKHGYFLDNFPVVFATTQTIPSSLEWSEKNDYLIIDEAAQTSTHHILALLTKFKNIIFVGDTMQLSVVVNVDEKEEADIFHESKLAPVYRNIDNSIPIIIEKTLPSDLSIMLKEHWRCAWKIAHYFNENIYNGQLRIMNKDQEGEMTFTPFNEDKFQEIVHKIENKYSENIKAKPQTIALISPYKEINKIESRIKKVGTTHKFQGYENETIVYVIDNKKLGMFNVDFFLRNQRLINVAVSRAKLNFHLYIGDKAWKSLKASKYKNAHDLNKLISHIEENEDKNSNINLIRSNFESDTFDKRVDVFDEQDKNFITKISKEIYDIIIKNDLSMSFGVRDIDINPLIKNIKQAKGIYDLVIFNKKGIIEFVIHDNQIIYQVNDKNTAFKKFFSKNILLHQAKKLMSERELFWWNKMNKRMYKKYELNDVNNWFIVPNMAIQKIIANDEHYKMHFDFVFIKSFFNKDDNNYYFKHTFFMELDDNTHNSALSKNRDKYKDEFSKRNDLKLIRIKI